MIVHLKTRNQYKTQSVYCGSKNCHSGYTNFGRNPNSVQITGQGIRDFFLDKEKRKKKRSVVSKKSLLVPTSKTKFVLH